MVKGVIFDLDGTLLNTLFDLHAAVNFALRKCSYPLRTLDEIRGFVGDGVVMLMHRSVPSGTDEQDEKICFELFRKYYLEHMNDTTAPYDGACEYIEKLHGMGIKTAVVSNKLHSAVEELCEKFFPLVDCCFGVSEESDRKPCPVNVERALEKMGCQKNEAVYFGDSEVDMKTAGNASVPFVAVAWGYRSREQLIDFGAKQIINSFNEFSIDKS